MYKYKKQSEDADVLLSEKFTVGQTWANCNSIFHENTDSSETAVHLVEHKNHV